MTIGLASDHAGFRLKSFLAEALPKEGYQIRDLGCESDAPVDYPKYGKIIADAMRSGKITSGILICGTGIGVSIAANRFDHVRAALVSDPLAARLTREINDANVLCLGGLMVGNWMALDCAKVFLTTEYSGGRHHARMEMLSQIRCA
jgi:ribose 5-phosphate isomerase B